MINFGFGVHIHQPMGNFASVIEDIYQKAYKPFLDLIGEFPKLKFNYHVSGCLLEWIIKNHPDFIEHLKKLVENQQAEILTSGFYEPILTLLPENDRLDQIKWYSDFLVKKFGVQPKGLWLTERVWEQNLAKSLVDAGVKYTVVDDTHFKYSGQSENGLYGYFTTEQDGNTLSVFPVSKNLRYFVPFQPVEKTIDFLQADMNQGPNRLRLLFDDGEKFGAWPGTFKHCYENGWLKQFFTAISQSDFIQTTLLSDFNQFNSPLGRIYLDNASYEEMGEWVLQPKVYEQYESVKRNLPPNFNLLRGGYFRNFLVKYPEANRLHKRMLYVSKKVAESTSKKKKEARIELFKGQCNDAYWHGIFGGLYLPHLRNGVYQHLVKADKMLEDESKHEPTLYDYDACGKKEIIFDNQEIFLVVSPHQGGAIQCLDIKKYEVNLFDIISRHQESYHSKIRPKGEPTGNQQESVHSIHSDLKLKDGNIASHLIYDSYERLGLLDHFLKPEIKVEDFSHNQYEEIYNVLFQNRTFRVSPKNIELSINGFCPGVTGRLEKKISSFTNSLRFSYSLAEIPASSAKPIRFGAEFGIRPLDYFLIDNKKLKAQTIQSLTALKAFKMQILDPSGEIKFISLNLPFDLWYFPIYSVSSSESGLERIYQGTVMLLSWLLANPATNFDFEISW